MINKKILYTAFACAILILIGISYLAYMNLIALQANANQVKESYSDVNLLNKIEKAVVDGETGQRGYIITKNYSYLEPYFGSKKEINLLIQQYRAANIGNPQIQLFDKVENLINSKFKELDYTVNLKEKGFSDSVVARINSNIGKNIMDSIRTSIDTLLLKESEILKSNEVNTLASSSGAVKSYVAGITISFAVIIFVFFSLLKEINLRSRLEQEANQGRLFFSTSLISIGDAVITTNEKAFITFMNKVAENLTKWGKDEAEGRPIETVFNIYKEGTRDAVLSPVKVAIQTKQIVGLNNHTILLDKFNNEIHIDDSAAPIINEKDEVTGAVLIFRDITEKRKTEIELDKSYEQLQELTKEMDTKINELQISNRDLESFSYSVSHDLRAPLRSIDGFSKILEAEYGNVIDDEGKRLLKIVRDNAVKMGVFIDELLNIAKVGKRALNYAIVDNNRLVEDAIELCSQDLENKNIFKIKPLLPSYADEVLLFEVWKNLISNAVKFSGNKENPSIEIGCEVVDSIVRFYVKDNGAGFNMSYANKLFQVFQRLHSESEFAGNGVGLALCEKIIRLHGGTISAKSVPDEETIFSFTVPNKS
ncbi:MAG: CHASE3 domain-containing protein [Bacteroidetes bacterium]|nr:CHASE3 domain-containing protein [Bacteroidota bacterium]